MAGDSVPRTTGAAAPGNWFCFSKLICEVAQAKYLWRKKEGDIKTLYEQPTMEAGSCILPPQVVYGTEKEMIVP